MPKTFWNTTSESAFGTFELLAIPSRYSEVMPSSTKLVDNVTINGLSSKMATRNPLTKPTTKVTTNTPMTARVSRIIGTFRQSDHHVGKQRDRRTHREIDAAHHDHQHLAEGDDGHDAADGEQDAP